MNVDADAPMERVHGPRRAWAAVALLAVVGTVNYADRFLPAVLAEPIKAELALSDTDIGIINGFGFVVVYAILGIPIARIADRGAFGLVISACLALWGTMTMLGGAVQSASQLVLTRVGVAVGEAGSTPAAHAYVARNFAPERRAAPLAVITMSIPLASAAGLIGGGLLAQEFGWRTTFVVMGALSVCLAPIVLIIVGVRQSIPAAESPQSSRPSTTWISILRRRSYLAILAGSVFVAVASYSLSTFAPAFLVRQHDMSLGSVGVQYGIASGVCGVVGLLAIGRMADRVSLIDSRWLVWLISAMAAAAIPFAVLAFSVGSSTGAVVFLGLTYVVGSAYLAPTVAAIQRLTPPAQRATASAILLFCNAIVGAAGPFVTGLISDALTPGMGPAALGRALLIVVPTALLLGAGCYLVASRRFLQEQVESVGRSPT